MRARGPSCAAFLTVLLGLSFAADGRADGPALRRGVSLSNWFQRNPDERNIERSDLDLVRAAGFDHVRIPFDPVLFGWTWRVCSPLHDVDRLRSGIQNAIQAGLDVVVDLHPDNATLQAIETEPGAEDALVRLWGMVSDQMAGLGPQHVVFELMNEPQYYGHADRWARLQHRLLAAVREHAPRNLIVLTGAQGGSLEGLASLEPELDSNVVYSFHFYLPYVFTHQGASWMASDPNTAAAFVHGLSYPARRLSVRQPLIDVPRKDAALREVAGYRRDDWSGARIARMLRPIAQWAAAHHVRVNCGEFGVFRHDAEPASRYAWIGDVRTAAESYGMGWTVWEYANGFGIAIGPDTPGLDGHRIEPEAREALGLVTAGHR